MGAEAAKKEAELIAVAEEKKKRDEEAKKKMEEENKAAEATNKKVEVHDHEKLIRDKEQEYANVSGKDRSRCQLEDAIKMLEKNTTRDEFKTALTTMMTYITN